jgi:hypothetical protein
MTTFGRVARGTSNQTMFSLQDVYQMASAMIGTQIGNVNPRAPWLTVQALLPTFAPSAELLYRRTGADPNETASNLSELAHQVGVYDPSASRRSSTFSRRSPS